MRYVLSLYASFLILFIGVSCKEDDKPIRAIPSCIQLKIDTLANSVVLNSPTQVFRYQYEGESVFKFKGGCCDQFEFVYSNQCEYICAPSGGFTGLGDGRCPNFSEEATHEELVWEDEQ
ncbi:MAG: hypothetical protein AAGC85_28150 [Bacteroidota bacterium]